MPKSAHTPTLAQLSDEALDAHIANLDSWLLFELADLEEAVAERKRRGRGLFELTAEAEAYLARFAGRPHAMAGA